MKQFLLCLLLVLAPLVPRGTAVSVHRGQFNDTTTVGVSGSTLTTLHTITLNRGGLQTNGSYNRVTYAGSFASNDNDKRLVVSFGGQTVEDSGAIDIDGVQGWKVVVEYTRISATSVLATAAISMGHLQFDSAGSNAGTGGRYISRTVTLTVADLDSNPAILLIQGQGSANNDVVKNLMLFEFITAPE